MAKIYARKIRSGEMAIEDVPARWRGQVRKLLENAEA